MRGWRRSFRVEGGHGGEGMDGERGGGDVGDVHITTDLL